MASLIAVEAAPPQAAIPFSTRGEREPQHQGLVGSDGVTALVSNAALGGLARSPVRSSPTAAAVWAVSHTATQADQPAVRPPEAVGIVLEYNPARRSFYWLKTRKGAAEIWEWRTERDGTGGWWLGIGAYGRWEPGELARFGWSYLGPVQPFGAAP